jgi:hypothetical protein
MDEDELAQVMSQFNLPELPDETDREVHTCVIVLFRDNEEPLELKGGIENKDAKEYANRTDTHGTGYFCGWWWE